MAEEDILKELDELSEIVEGGEEEGGIAEELKAIEELTSVPSEEKAGEEIEELKEEKVEKVEGEEERKEKVEKVEKKREKKKKIKPEKMIKREFHLYRIASALLIGIGLAVYALAFYLRWDGWRLVRFPPSAAIAIVGTLLILGGGEVYYRGKRRV